MLGVKGRSSRHNQTSSVDTSRKRQLASEVLDGSPPDMLPRKRMRSSGNELELEGSSSTFPAKCFYSPNRRGGYQTPLERQRQREQHGIILPSKPPPESDKNTKKAKKVPMYRSFNVSHTGRGSHRSQSTRKTGQKLQTKPAESKKTGESRDESQSRSLEESGKLAEASPKKITTKKSPKKRSPSKRSPRKSPRKGVKKAVKLYIQGMKKNPKAASKRTTQGRKRKADEADAVQKKATKDIAGTAQETELKQRVQHKRASKKLDLDPEGCTNEMRADRITDTDTDDDVSVIAPSPKPGTKKRSMRLKEESGVSASSEKVEQLPRKSERTSVIKTRHDGTADQRNFLEGFEPQTPDSVTSQIAQKVSPRKAAVTIPSFMTPPISPSTSKRASSTTNSPSTSNKASSATHSPATSTPLQQRKLNVMKKMIDNDGMEQMTMDVGQKRFGATTCETCGMVYTAAHPEDEASHDKFHRKYLTAIKFPGWKKERLLQEFDDGRVIMVLHDDPKYHTKKVEEIRQLVDHELGFLQGGDIACKTSSKVYLFITTEKKVAGCLIAEEISKGYRVIADAGTGQSSTEEQKQFEQQRAWCCETDPEPAVCGVSRIWVASQERRKQIATKLLDCLRNFFMFGSVLSKESIAFSDPTPDGKMLATSYMKTARFLVYKYH